MTLVPIELLAATDNVAEQAVTVVSVASNTPPAIEAPPKTRRIAIFGLAPSTRGLAPKKGEFDGQRWSLNDGHIFSNFADCDVWFDLHPEDWFRDPARRAPGHMEFLSKFAGTAYMQAHHADIPSSVAYPKQDVLAFYGRSYFTSTVAWMLGLAIIELSKEQHAEPPELWLFGVDLAGSAEYTAQRPAAEWLLGWAEGMGIRVMLPEACPLLRGDSYGFFEEGDPGRALLRRKIDSERMALKAHAQKHNNEALIHQGRMDEAERIFQLVNQ